METLVMLWGAYLQAPHAPHAYFLKCKTEDIRNLAKLFLEGQVPRYLRVTGAPVNIETLVKSIHKYSSFLSDEFFIKRLTDFARYVLETVNDQDHQHEFNSLKHGLRTRHGGFELLLGLEKVPGVAADAADMSPIGASHDSSAFYIARPLKNATHFQSRINFQVEEITVPWSLEKTLCDLQLLSVMITNTVSTLLIANGSQPDSVKFHRPIEADNWWKRYDELGRTGVTRMSMAFTIDANNVKIRSDTDVKKSYRNT